MLKQMGKRSCLQEQLIFDHPDATQISRKYPANNRNNKLFKNIDINNK